MNIYFSLLHILTSHFISGPKYLTSFTTANISPFIEPRPLGSSLHNNYSVYLSESCSAHHPPPQQAGESKPFIYMHVSPRRFIVVLLTPSRRLSFKGLFRLTFLMDVIITPVRDGLANSCQATSSSTQFEHEQTEQFSLRLVDRYFVDFHPDFKECYEKVRCHSYLFLGV